jgi:hypothetical protein
LPRSSSLRPLSSWSPIASPTSACR